jgi:hypothetical protein
MLSSALKIGRLPAQGVSEALKRSANPSAIEALSTAIAKASLSGIEDEKIEVSGLTVDIDFDEDRLLATGGLATAISLGSVYWLGSKLDVQYRYNQLSIALRNLSQGIALGNEPLVQESFKKIDDLSNPLLNPRTLEPIDDVDTVKDLYQYLFNKPAQSGSMFNAKVLKESVEEGLKLGTQLSIRTAKEAVDETLEAVVKKASSKAGFVIGRAIGAVLFIDTIWWLSTSALDIGLNYLGVDEDKQRIPILADIPIIGSLFDLSDSFGSSAVDLVITPILNFTIEKIFGKEAVETLSDILWGIIISAGTNPLLSPFIIAILDFYIDNIDVNAEVSIEFNLSTIESNLNFDMFGVFRPEPYSILILWLYAITGKLIFRHWLQPIIGQFR